MYSYFCRSKNTIIAKLLMENMSKGECKKLVNKTNKFNESPLYVAVEYSDNEELVELLLEKYFFITMIEK